MSNVKTAEDTENLPRPLKIVRFNDEESGDGVMTARRVLGPLNTMELDREPGETTAAEVTAYSSSKDFRVIAEVRYKTEDEKTAEAQRERDATLQQVLRCSHSSSLMQRKLMEKAHHHTVTASQKMDEIISKLDNLLARQEILTVTCPLSSSDPFDLYGLILWDRQTLMTADFQLRWTAKERQVFSTATFRLEGSHITRTSLKEMDTGPLKLNPQEDFHSTWKEQGENWDRGRAGRFHRIVLVSNNDAGPLIPLDCQCRQVRLSAIEQHDRRDICRSRRLVQDCFIQLRHEMMSRPLRDVRSMKLESIARDY